MEETTKLELKLQELLDDLSGDARRVYVAGQLSTPATRLRGKLLEIRNFVNDARKDVSALRRGEQSTL